MKKLEECNWKAFALKDVFDEIQRGKRLKTDDHIAGSMPYVSSSSIDNGVDNFIGNKDGVRIFEDCITLANSGSVGMAFYQPFKFVASDHVTKLKLSFSNKYIYLFLANQVSKLAEKYSFNREINDARINREYIVLPINSKDEPDYAFMEEYMREVERQQKEKYKAHIQKKIEELGDVEKLEDKEWKAFNIDDIFIVGSGVRLTKDNQKIGNRPFIGSTDSNNGITEFVSNTNESLDRNVLGVNYNGSVVENFYHPYEAVFSDDVKRLHLKNFEDNKFVYLFIKSAILQQKVKYQYGYKFNGERMKRQSIMLPVNSEGEPDYVFMENYMKRKEMEMLKRYVDFIDK